MMPDERASFAEALHLYPFRGLVHSSAAAVAKDTASSTPPSRITMKQEIHQQSEVV